MAKKITDYRDTPALIFAWGISYDLSNFSDDFTPFFDFERP